MPGWAELGWSVFAMRHSKSMPGACICPGSALSLLIRGKKSLPKSYSPILRSAPGLLGRIAKGQNGTVQRSGNPKVKARGGSAYLGLARGEPAPGSVSSCFSPWHRPTGQAPGCPRRTCGGGAAPESPRANVGPVASSLPARTRRGPSAASFPKTPTASSCPRCTTSRTPRTARGVARRLPCRTWT